MFEEFCGSKFWSFNISKNSTNDDFTVCFQDTFLVWVPCGFLLFLSLFYFCFLKKTFDIGNTWLNLLKTILSVLLTILTTVDVFWSVREYSSGQQPHVAHILAPCVTSLAMALTIVLIQYGRRRGEKVCGLLFLYWTMQTVAGIIVLQSRIRSHLRNDDVYHVTYSSIFLILVVVQLLLSGFAVDKWKRAYSPQLNMKEVCPEVHASFMSRLTFWWFTRLVTRGYKKSLEQSDLWSLDPEISSGHVVPKFERRWNQEVKKYLKSLDKRRKKDNPSEESDMKAESKALMLDKDQVMIDIAEAPPTSRTYTINNKKKKTKKVPRPSLWLALGRTFGLSFLFGSILKLCHDILIFICPVLLQAILRYVKNPDAHHWEGYMYAILIFSVTFVQSMFLHQYFHRCMVVGMNVRTSLVGAIYKKSLKLGNQARKTSTVGEIVNLMSADAQRFMELTTYLNMLWSAPFQICVSLYMLWDILGPAVLSGVAVMILLIPVNAFIAKKNKAFQVEQMKFKDTRIKLMSEILNGIKVLKLYAWEPSFQKKVMDIRHKELLILRKMSYLSAASSFLWNCSPFMVSLASFATYVLSSTSNVLDAEKAFVSLSLFNILRFPLSMLPHLIANMVQTSVSVKRLEVFLIHEELDESSVKHVKNEEEPAVNIVDGSFDWEMNPEKPVLDEVNVKIEKGTLVGIVGQVGCGKSTLLSAMLGEAEKLNGSVVVNGSVAFVAQQAWMQNASVVNNVLFGGRMEPDRYEEVVDACALKPDLDLLPARDETEIGEKGINLSGGQKQRISLARAVYADADIYLLDDTLSAVDSHVGKHIFDRVLGKKGLLKNKTRIFVTHGLKFLPDFDSIIVLNGGKVSEVGSYDQLLKKKGDFAKFLDAHIKQEMDKGQGLDEEEINLRESILSTIGSDAAEIKEKITRLRRDTSRSESPEATPVLGRSMPGSPRLEVTLEHKGEGDNDVFDANHQKVQRTLSQNSSKTQNNVKQEGEGLLMKPNGNKRIITEEKMETGNVKLSVFAAYLKALTVPITIGVLIFYFLQISFNIGVSFWLSHWSNDIAEESLMKRYLVTDPNTTFVPDLARDEYKVKMRLTVYGLLGLGQSLAVLFGAFLLAHGALSASSKLHKGILDRGLRAPMSFFESTPTGRIINRFAKDIDVVDSTLPTNFDMFSKCTMAVFGTLFVISFNTPIFIVVVLPLAVVYFFVQRFYIKTSRQLRRLESVSRSPIFSHFGETIQGTSTIRAYNQLDRFIRESEKRVDENLVSYYPGIASNRWLAVRLEFVGNTLVFFSALFSILGKENLTPGMVGLSITYALNITQTLNWMVRMSGEVETNVVAVERIKEYSETETEAEWIIDSNRPPSDWPSKGKLDFKTYSVTYRSGLEPVLKEITCSLKPGEKVGIAGRTGAGKSSLAMGLFRILEPCGGSIFIDDIDITTIGLHDLRSKLTIIPQDPVLFSGSLKMNLDPFDIHPENEIWNALRHAHLEEYVRSLPDGLSHQCGEGGVNLSVGQRQLLCLARALLRRTRILILDEATAAVDVNTDKLIQSTIETYFKHCTVLTIAHRINTIIDYDRVMVLDYGTLKELESPETLISKKESYFYSLAKEDGLL